VADDLNGVAVQIALHRELPAWLKVGELDFTYDTRSIATQTLRGERVRRLIA
jgi:hypothetical protein